MVYRDKTQPEFPTPNTSWAPEIERLAVVEDVDCDLTRTDITVSKRELATSLLKVPVRDCTAGTRRVSDADRPARAVLATVPACPLLAAGPRP